MKFFIVERSRESKEALKKTLRRLDCEYGQRNPDIIISLGGDGTFLHSERLYPGIPKLLIRDSKVCKKCDDMGFDELFMKIMLKNFTCLEYSKIEATFKRIKYLAINDFVIRNKSPTHAIRFQVTIDDKPMEPMIGDGIVVSTVFGSTGYHYSITKKKFSKGIGLAYNNITGNIRSKVLHENSVIRMKLLRHDADFGMDNDPKILTLREGEILTIRGSEKVAKIIKVI